MRTLRLVQLPRRIWNGLRRRLLPKRVYRKAPLRVKPQRTAPAGAAPADLTWRTCVRQVEVDDPVALAGRLFRRRFGHRPPDSPRHFVLLYCPDGDEAARRAVSYVNCRPVEDVHLIGGLCVDELAYRALPKWLLRQVRNEGGFATILARESLVLLGDSLAVFAHVGELRSRQAALRVGFVDTEDPHLMVYWRFPVPAEERKRLVALAARHAPF